MSRINKFLSKFNLRIEKISKNQNLYDVLAYIFKKLEINVLLDIGANEGQFANKVRKNGYAEKIISFEPLKDVYKELIKNSEKDINWTTQNFALGDYNGETIINESNYSLSSSILPMTNLHLDAKKDSSFISQHKISIKKIDTYIQEKKLNYNNIFLKIDTQGTENKVLDGANNNLDKIKGILCELSLDELYLGQKLWIEIIEKMKSKNYEVWYLEKGFQHPKNRKVLQLDCIFLNKNYKDKIQ